MKMYPPLLILFVIGLSVHVSNAQTRPGGSGGFHLVGTNKVDATLATPKAKERISGRVSLGLSSIPGNAQQLRVRDFNIVFFGVPQRLIAPRARPKQPLGVVAFAVSPGKIQSLRLNSRRSQISGQLEMSGDAAVLSSLIPSIRDEGRDLFPTPRLVTTAKIRIDLETPLGDGSVGVMKSRARLALSLSTRGSRYKDFEVSRFTIGLTDNSIVDLDLATDTVFIVGRQLCVQPINITFFHFDPFGPPPHFILEISGRGWPFGEPGAHREWQKADVFLEVRPWKNVFANVVLHESRAGLLLDLVDDDDCVEVFFVKALSPSHPWGGGATFGSGATAKIISSDENAVFGIDLTHLAHELGHVLGLDHPGVTSAGFQTANTGTLMCPSGFMVDNPRVNSQQNSDRVANPLLVTTLRRLGIGVDCLNDADCGPC